MATTGFDELATTLRDMAQRFGDTAFTDRRRLIALLSDRLPDSRRDIKVVAAAVDERVFASLAQCRPEQLDMEVERLAANLESGLGIRTDVAVPVVQACAYALALGPLPSQAGGPGIAPAPQPRPPAARTDGWVGLSEPVSPPRPATPPPAAVPAVVKPGGTKRWLYGLGAAVVVGGFALSHFATLQPDNPPAAPQPQPQPQPVMQPAPTRPVEPPPVQPQPVRPQPQPPPQVPEPQPQPISYGNETVDFGIPPQGVLKSDVGNPTPLTVPGAHTVTTMQVASEMRQNHRMVLADSLADAHPMTISGAVYLPNAGGYGNFSDQIQSRLANDLNSLTHGQHEIPIVFFCQGVRCWESYNAALRARAAGYPNVYWYRGGLASWQEAGLPMQPLQR